MADASNVPAPLKSVTPFLRHASELAAFDPLMSYHCRFYATQQGIKLKDGPAFKSDRACMPFVLGLLDQLEKDKKRLGTLLEEDGMQKEYVEGFALKIFAMADKQDRDGRTSKETAKNFYAAANFYEIINQWGPLPPDVAEKCKYGKWRAAQINKAIKNGEPIPPVENSSNDDAELDAFAKEIGSQDGPSFPSVPTTSATKPEDSFPSFPSFPSIPTSSTQPTFPNFPSMPTTTSSAKPSSGGPSFPNAFPIPPSSTAQDQIKFPSFPPSQPAFPTFPDPAQPTYKAPASGAAGFPPATPPYSGYPPSNIPNHSSPFPSANSSSSQAPRTDPPPYVLPTQSSPAQRPASDLFSRNAQHTSVATIAPVAQPPPAHDSTFVPDYDLMQLAQKHAKFAVSALQYEDVPTAVSNLKLALKELTGITY